MTSLRNSVTGLTLLGAGAGSGKTHRLTSIVTRAVGPEGPAPVALEGLVAVTYTRKAATELDARIRRALVEANAHVKAQELPLAYLGTVHAVCLRLLREFALDAGLSPLVDVLPGDEASVLRQALEWGLPSALRERLDRLAEDLEVHWDPRVRRWDWLDPVQEVMTLARSNRIPAKALPTMADRSSRRLCELMGVPESDSDALDTDLARVLDAVLGTLAQLDIRQKNTRDARRDLEIARRHLQTGDLKWSRWVGLQKTNAGKAARGAVAPLIEVAERVDRHPRLHSQIRAFTTAVYEAATIGLTVYETWKRERRLVDFVDMVDHALTLVDLPDVRSELARRLELVVVDEFQDTSPLQLALFVKLHELSGRSTWVGDPKQCIFEYAGADPALMDAVAEWVGTAGGKTEAMLENWRSRPELVDAASRLFATALMRHGYRPEEVAMTAKRGTPAELEALPPFGVWWLQAQNKNDDAEALAEGVRTLLEAPNRTRIVDRVTDKPRGLLPLDVAVLVATNLEAETITTALARRGIRAAIARAGLLETPEGTLVEAALSYTADPRDARSLAVVEALTGFSGKSPDAWLDGWITEHSERARAREAGESLPPRTPSEVAQRLAGVRDDLHVLAPAETLDRILSVIDAAAICARWPDSEQRLANLDALRALAARYEARCQRRRESAGVAGLLRFFVEMKQKVIVQNEERASDDQHTSHGQHCVTVTTYHKAKGLEWPVVVLASLDREERRDAFSVAPESDRDTFDPTEPLGGRWIRYWPWPYASHENAPLAAAVARSPEGRVVQERETRERVRLLYVGFTRARDHLIFAIRPGKQGPKTAWLNELCDEAGLPLLDLPTPTETDAQATVGIRGVEGSVSWFPARVWSLSTGGDPVGVLPKSDSTGWFAGTRGREHSRYRISPSRAAVDWPQIEVGEVGQVAITGPRLPLGSESPKDWSSVGDAFHAFLAADLPGLTRERRLERACRLLAASDLLALLEPDALLRAGDQLRSWVDTRWPRATWHRELPIAGVLSTSEGSRRIEGTIDLLLEMEDGVVLIDHKSYPGRKDTWRDKAREYAPQLAAYAQVLGMAGRNVSSQWISFAVTGGVVQINERRQPPRAVAWGG